MDKYAMKYIDWTNALKNTGEFDRLRQMLDEADIPYQAADSFGVKNIKVPDQQRPKISVSYGLGTYGHKEGLLETWTLKRRDEPKGWQTAKEAYKTILSIIRKEGVL